MIDIEEKSAGVCNAYYTSALGSSVPYQFEVVPTRRFVYVSEGWATVRHKDLNQEQPANAGELLDFMDCASSKQTEVEVRSERCSWVGIYSKQPDHQISATLLQGQSLELSLSSLRESILVLRGSAIANGKIMTEKQFAFVPSGVPVQLEIPDGSVCIHLKRTA